MRGRRLERFENPASKENERSDKQAGTDNMELKGLVGTSHAPPAANTRKALGDIGNLVGTAAVRGQVANPVKQEVVTTWGAQQRRSALATGDVAKAATAADDKAEPVVDESNLDANSSAGSGNARALGLPPAVPRPKAVRGQRALAAKKVPSFSATLTARSAACFKEDTEQVESDEPVENIDEADIGNPLAVVDYVDDIYSFYRKAEMHSRATPDYMSRQKDVNDKMRAILIDWLIEVQQKFSLMPETLFLTTNLIDRYLSIVSVSRKNLQLVGVTAMLLAAKYEEIIAPEVETMVYIADDAYTREEVLAMEKAMLNALRFNLTVPTPYVFIVRFLKAASSDKQMESLAFYLMELCLTEYMMVKYRPSHLAAAAVYTANQTLGRVPFWTATLVRHAGYTESQLKACSRMMVKFHRKAGEGRLVVVYKKYSSPIFKSVASISAAVIPDSESDNN